MTGGVRIDQYDWRRADGTTGRETMLRFGPDTAPRVVVALPLYEEANRTRAFAVTLLRALARRGIGGVLPELPGTGESLVATRDATLDNLRSAFAAAAGEGHVAVSIRSGALIDTAAHVLGRWQLAPIDGGDLVRELGRVADGEGGFAGNIIGAVMLRELASARPAPARVVRLASDPRDADLKLAASPLWRRAEPGNDPALADALASDIATWIATCAG